MTSLFFNTTNDYKWEEAELIAQDFETIELRRLKMPVVEVNSLDIEFVGRQKVLQVFKRYQVPVFVEHGALNIGYLKGLPGPLSEPFWDVLGGDICSLIPDDDRACVARSVVAYCDGRKVSVLVSDVNGTIADEARGERAFQWDPIFVRDGETSTFAEMTVDQRATRSQASLSYRELFATLSESG